MDATQLRTYIVDHVLEFLAPEIPVTVAAANLVMGTAAQESHLEYIDQLTPGPGPAFGLFQMEEATHNDIWHNYLWFNTALANKLKRCSLGGGFSIFGAHEMGGNLYYAVAMCRVHYRRVPENLPAANSIPGLARYWKRYYNTHLGKGTEAEFIRNYRELING
jgi:hypothetical protein